MTTATMITITIFAGGIIFSIIGFFLKNSIVGKIDELFKAIEKLNDKFSDLKEEMLKDYVRKEDFEHNIEAHKEFWIEINKTKERVSILENKNS